MSLAGHMNLLVTGGAGFIGSTYVRLARRLRPDEPVVNVDALTYAGNLENLRDLEGDTGHLFVRGDIRDGDAMLELMRRHAIDAVVNFAAESHVDRSIMSAEPFLDTNVGGTRAARRCARGRRPPLRAGLDRRSLRQRSADRRLQRGDARSRRTALLGQQGGRRPLRAGVSSHLRHGHGDHALLEQLRALPVPREADPALDHERLRRQAAAGLRRRPAGARLDPRRRPLRGDRRRPARGRRAARSTTSAPGRAPNLDVVRAILRLGGPRRIADSLRGGPPRPRSSLRHERDQDPRPRWAGARAASSTTAWRRRSPGTAATAPGRKACAAAPIARITIANTRRGWPRHSDAPTLAASLRRRTRAARPARTTACRGPARAAPGCRGSRGADAAP